MLQVTWNVLFLGLLMLLTKKWSCSQARAHSLGIYFGHFFSSEICSALRLCIVGFFHKMCSLFCFLLRIMTILLFYQFSFVNIWKISHALLFVVLSLKQWIILFLIKKMVEVFSDEWNPGLYLSKKVKAIKEDLSRNPSENVPICEPLSRLIGILILT